MRARRGVHGQWQVSVDFTKKKIRTRIAGNQIGVLADPAEAGIARQGFLEHWCAVTVDTIAVGPQQCTQLRGQPLQAAPHELVVVAAEGITRDIGEIRIVQHTLGRACCAGPVIHASADHPHRARQQLGGPAAFVPVARHIAHFTVSTGRQPGVQMTLVSIELHVTHADRAETEFARP